MKKCGLVIFICIVFIIGFIFFQYFFDDKVEELVEENIITNSILGTEIDSLTNKIINFKVTKISISVEDVNSTEGLEYTDPKYIENTSKISNLINDIDKATFYPEELFESKYGVGGFFEGAPIVNIYGENGEELMLCPLDNFYGENIFYIFDKNGSDEKKLYKSEYKIEEKVLDLIK